jgi:hypothetical protein
LIEILFKNSANLYADFLKGLPIKMVWYYAANKELPNITCNYAFNFTASLAKKISIPVGIISDTYAWNQTFGSLNACPKFSAVYPLFYNGYQQQWQAFGGWA